MTCQSDPSRRFKAALLVQDAKEEPHLTPEQLRHSASLALESAMQVVGRCADIEAAELDKWYRLECAHGAFDKVDEPGEVEDVLLEDVVIADLLEKALFHPATSSGLHLSDGSWI